MIRFQNVGGGNLVAHNKGFTLAEVLVTLGIIGVVSAMTIPTLMQNHQRKTYVTQFHKVYNEIQQASLQYMSDHNALNLREAGLNSRAKVGEFFNNYFKVVNTCEEGDVRTPCLASEYRSIDGTSELKNFSGWGAAYCVTLASGASILLDHPALYTLTVNGVNSYYGHVVIDVNGSAGPNIGGRDVFRLEFYDDGSLDVLGATPECKSKGVCNGQSLTKIRENLYNSNCLKNYSGYGCIGKILNDNWEMNY